MESTATATPVTAISKKVFVHAQKNGVVVHKHDGANGWHDPSRKHGQMTRFGVDPDLHKSIGNDAMMEAEGFAALSDADKAQYIEALAGKTFWIYSGKKASDTSTVEADAEAIKEQLDDLEKAFDGHAEERLPEIDETVVNGQNVPATEENVEANLAEAGVTQEEVDKLASALSTGGRRARNHQS